MFARRGDGVVYLLHILAADDNKERLLKREARLRPGQGLRLRYTYRPERETRGVQSRTVVRLESGSELELHHTAARMAVRRGAEGPQPGVLVGKFEIISGG